MSSNKNEEVRKYQLFKFQKNANEEFVSEWTDFFLFFSFFSSSFLERQTYRQADRQRDRDRKGETERC